MIRYFGAFYRVLWFMMNYFRFKKLGFKSYINSPLRITGRENMVIGCDVVVEYKCWLAAVCETGLDTCELIIGKGSRIGNFNHIYSTNSIVIGNYVLTADNVYIADNSHRYEDVRIPIYKQDIIQKKKVVIADGAWIGENVCVIGANVGRNSVIGANSVVLTDIPDYCVAVGTPARVIKRYCFDNQDWLKTDINGNFLKL